MAKLPLRLLGLFLLCVALTVTGCQALFHSTALPELPQMLEELTD